MYYELALILGVFSACAVVKLCKFHPSDSFSPRRELQESIQCLDSSNSLRRPRLGLGEIQSRLGEIGSPKRGRGSSLGEQAWLKREWRGATFLCTIWTVCLVFPRLRKLFACVCGVGLEGLSLRGVWYVLDGWTHDGHGIV